MQASVQPTCFCFMTVACRRHAWSLYVSSMLPDSNLHITCGFYACNRHDCSLCPNGGFQVFRFRSSFLASVVAAARNWHRPVPSALLQQFLFFLGSSIFSVPLSSDSFCLFSSTATSVTNLLSHQYCWLKV